MSKAKTKIEKAAVEQFVKEKFAEDANSFEIISDGESSQAFFFSSQNGDFVIRVNKKSDGFEKDKYAYKNFHSNHIPIPEMISLGKLDEDLQFSITRKAEGELLSSVDKEKKTLALPSIISTLDAIHSVDISHTTGLGWFDKNGKANLKTFREQLERVITQTKNDYEEEKDNKLLDKDVTEQLLEKHKSLLNFCPEIRYLVHADFGTDNATVKDNKITGVFDWEHAMYGDFLYDVAWLDFWGNKNEHRDKIDYKSIFLKHYREKGVDIDNYDERLLLYKLNFGIGAMMFFMKSEQEKKCLETKAYLLELAKDL